MFFIIYSLTRRTEIYNKSQLKPDHRKEMYFNTDHVSINRLEMMLTLLIFRYNHISQFVL